jgi:competence protein ComEC
MMISKKYFFFGALFGLVLLFVFIISLPDRKLHVVFCNVGQGDSAYIRTPDGKDMLIDGGPDDSVLSCLGRHMPFYDRTIDLVLLTHPQKDHMKGLVSVVLRYTVKNIIKLPIENGTKEISELNEAISNKAVVAKSLYKNDGFSMGQVNFQVLWPDKDYVTENTEVKDSLSKKNELSNKVLGVSKSFDLNEFSYYLAMTYGKFDALFTGDGDSEIQPKINISSLTDLEVVKVPHHGSKKSLDEKFLELIHPKLAVISVGKNGYGHPSAQAMKQLSDLAVKIKRTDKDGDVEIISDGEKWWVK